jgi:hypothetical protein
MSASALTYTHTRAGEHFSEKSNLIHTDLSFVVQLEHVLQRHNFNFGCGQKSLLKSYVIEIPYTYLLSY